MKSVSFVTCRSLVLLMFCAAAFAAEPAAPPPSSAALVEARIPFANHGGIYNWHVENDRSILIQSQSRKWYRATLFSPCFDLPFAERIGFETEPSGSFDKFSSIRVRGQTCRLNSLVETAAPAKKPGKPDAPAPAPAPKAGAPG